MRNYSALYLLLLVAWVAKLAEADQRVFGGWRVYLTLGPIPWWGTLGLVLVLYGGLAWVVVAVPRAHPPESELWKPEKELGEKF